MSRRALKLVGKAFLDRFSGRFINSHPALLPSFPGMYGPPRRAGVRVQITGVTIFMVDAGWDSGPIVRRRGTGQPGDDEHACTSGSRTWSGPLLVDTVGRRSRGLTPRGEGCHTVSRISDEPWTASANEQVTKTADPAALISVYTRPVVELGRGLAGAGVQIVSTGSTAAALRGAGVRVIRGRERPPRLPPLGHAAPRTARPPTPRTPTVAAAQPPV